MDLTILGDMIVNFGFPMVCCGVLAWFVFYRDKKHTDEIIALNAQHRADISALNSAHKEEIAKLSASLDRNTAVMEKLLFKLEKEG